MACQIRIQYARFNCFDETKENEDELLVYNFIGFARDSHRIPQYCAITMHCRQIKHDSA